MNRMGGGFLGTDRTLAYTGAVYDALCPPESAFAICDSSSATVDSGTSRPHTRSQLASMR
ncbi:hypothetical protein SCNU_13403 [Gordonia neofelifaecis NRRL B-59395]|uniref:Uncharacterized protein n=1 Tax=Gordonia neofelifaecis NRRL B-59395 TaxID=644548 RepID=F1YLC1_9ACTN|nr:hypothetical protein SCNU_13403 [Gordonia neofelifaecis NRRL B-59395]